jgi:uncharacterized metal-binding protein
LLILWVAELGFSVRIGVLVGLLFGLTSLAWPHSRTFFGEQLATFFLTLCGYGLRRNTRLWWALAGAAAVGALATKVQTGLALPVLALYALAVCWQGNRQAFARALGGRLLFGLLGLALPFGLLLAYNTLIFGAPTNSGYGSVGAQAVAQHGNWRTGLYGLTISTGKGLLFYAPSLLLGLIGLGARPRQQWRESMLAALMLISHLAFYSNACRRAAGGAERARARLALGRNRAGRGELSCAALTTAGQLRCVLAAERSGRALFYSGGVADSGAAAHLAQPRARILVAGSGWPARYGAAGEGFFILRGRPF